MNSVGVRLWGSIALATVALDVIVGCVGSLTVQALLGCQGDGEIDSNGGVDVPREVEAAPVFLC